MQRQKVPATSAFSLNQLDANPSAVGLAARGELDARRPLRRAWLRGTAGATAAGFDLDGVGGGEGEEGGEGEGDECGKLHFAEFCGCWCWEGRFLVG